LQGFERALPPEEGGCLRDAALVRAWQGLHPGFDDSRIIPGAGSSEIDLIEDGAIIRCAAKDGGDQQEKQESGASHGTPA
jgi:hypothetical protein